MSVAEVVSMAMAELLVIMLKVSGRHGGTCADPKTIRKKIFIATGSHRVGDDGRHVDQGSPC